MTRSILVLLTMLLLTAAITAQQTAEFHTEKAKEIAGGRDFAGAAAEVGKAIAIEPGDAELYLRRAHYYKLAGNIGAMRPDVDKAFKLAPNSESVIEQASRLHDTGDSQDCRTMLAMTDAFLSTNSQSDKGYEARFRAKTCLGDTVGAFNDISMAAQLNPASATHRMNRANIISRLGDSAEAHRIIENAIAKLDADLNAAESETQRQPIRHELRSWLMSRAGIYQKSGDYVNALADANRMVDLQPDPFSLNYRSRLHRRMRQYTEAVADLNRVIELIKGDKFHLFWERADVLAEAGKLPEALADYEETLRLLPSERTRLEARIAAVRKQMEAGPR